MKKILLFFMLVIIFICIIIFVLVYNGVIWLNTPDFNKYPVVGLDVSNHQKDIDWNKISNEDIKFVFIKATEGSDFTDKRFLKNWEGAKRNSIKRGAYHYFHFQSKAIEQAENFIRYVPDEPDMLPPVIDLEYGGNSKEIPSREKLRNELDIFIQEIQTHYIVKPILYLTYESYNDYIKGAYEDYDIWIRDIFGFPNISNRDWVFWQFSSMGKVPGINTFVDKNVFNGSYEDFCKKYQ